jgi:hypothetical protein
MDACFNLEHPSWNAKDGSDGDGSPDTFQGGGLTFAGGIR